MKLEIVSHCWHYAPHLTYQLSSLILFPPQHADVTMTVFYSDEDHATVEVLSFFNRIEAENLNWSWRRLPKEQLFRRSIGRNLAALETTADWIWFADADMCFRAGCLDALAHLAPAITVPLIFPRTVQISGNHTAGDVALEKSTDRTRVVDIDPADFVTHRYGRAIGGVQIVRGEIAHVVGYNRNSERFQRPIPRWQRCHDDVAFRRSLNTRGEPVELPELYRIRHEKYGRRDEFGRRQQQVRDDRSV